MSVMAFAPRQERGRVRSTRCLGYGRILIRRLKGHYTQRPGPFPDTGKLRALVLIGIGVAGNRGCQRGDDGKH